MHERQAINLIVGNFQGAKGFMEIQIRRENGGRDYTSFCKVKTMIIMHKACNK